MGQRRNDKDMTQVTKITWEIEEGLLLQTEKEKILR